MPTTSLRLALLATAFALPGALLAQAPAPASTPAPASAAPPKGASAPAVSKSANAPAATAAPAAQPTGDGGNRYGKKNKSANGAPGSATGSANPAPTNAQGASPPPKSARAKEGSGPGKTVGMQRAFADLQTNEEFNAYKDKAQAVKTVGECRTLMENTRKQLEPRAKAQNKAISVDIDKACATAKERMGLTG